jgi:NAD-dependent deacetylase
LDFYNQRRKQLHEVQPNVAHQVLVELEQDFDIHIITQNVDDLHERAGSQNVLHLHGELLKVRSTRNELHILDWRGDLQLGDCDANGAQLRPHIVWFGEAVPALQDAIVLVKQADYVVIIGTSLQVYPAAGLTDFAPKNVPIFYIDPKAATISNLRNPLTTITMNATHGITVFKQKLLELEKKTKS